METKELAVKRGRDNEEEETEIGGSSNSELGRNKNRPRLDHDHVDEMAKKKVNQNKGSSGSGLENEARSKDENQNKGSSGDELENGTKIRDGNERIQNHARFVYIKSEMRDIPMTKANPFRVTETIRRVVGGDVKKVKPLKSGDLLVEAFSKEQVEKLCKIKKIGELPVFVRVARQFNIVKGVIFAPSLVDMEEEEIINELKECKVVQAKFINKGPTKRRTPLIILTFSTDIIPTELRCGYLNVRVDKYIPPPLRCFKCNGFGHTANACKKEVSCTRCAGKHLRDECINMDIKCSNCQSNEHGALDRACPVYMKEKEIITIKMSEEVTYFEARKRYEKSSYATVAKNNNRTENGMGVRPNNDNESMDKDKNRNGQFVEQNKEVNVGASTSTEGLSQRNGVEMEIGAVGNDKNGNMNNTQHKEREAVELISLVVNLMKIMNRNPGKVTIQARQISNLIYKTTSHKIEVCDLIKALQ